MKRYLAAGLALASTLVLAVETNTTAPDATAEDPDTFANLDQFRVIHIDLNLTVDFVDHQLLGSVVLEVQRLDPAALQLVLDERDLDIGSVMQLSTDIVGATAPTEPVWVSRPFQSGKKDKVLGSALVIDLPASRAATEKVRIEYRTSPGASALQWLGPEQTAGKSQPFLYTQSSPIGARSWIPLQDTPQVRAAYSAIIHTPADLLAVMSAANDPRAKRTGEYVFAMPQAIPSYMIALAVGDLVFKATSPRSGVYAERSMAGAAAKAFADSDAVMKAFESLFGGYRWGRSDVLVLPPAFPADGMPNPRLSFISTAVVADAAPAAGTGRAVADQGEPSVLPQALAAAWSGNLVSNATWRDLWISEGFSAYAADRVMELRAGVSGTQVEESLALNSLNQDLARVPRADQALAVDLRDRDPAEAFSRVPAEKGRLFLCYLAAKFGAAHFDDFLRAYFQRFAFHGLTTAQLVAYLQVNLLDRYPGIVSRDEVLAWIFDPGIPADAVLPPATAVQAVDEARNAWLQGKMGPGTLETEGWLAPQWLYFLEGLPSGTTGTQLADLDRRFGFSHTKNAAAAQVWFLAAIRAGYHPADGPLEDYLRKTGRSAAVEPLYAELLKSPSGTAFAKRIYTQARPTYHASLKAILDPLVKPVLKPAAEK